ncbi:MAG: hypothetical protein M3300_10950 [Actinomycetota bacterium]|nr:hypothetical protein [Actinomycetota bacterium]
MTSTTSPPEILRTAWDIVVTDDGIDELSKQLTASQLRTQALGILVTASHAAHQVLDGKLLDGFIELLQRLDLMSLVFDGWRSYTKLIDTARESRSTPRKSHKVVMSNHQITSTHHPTIEVIINETQRYTARLTVTINFDLRLICAIVQDAALVAIESGSCLTSVTLGFEDFPALMKRERELAAAAMIRLHSPIRLLRD